MPNDDVYPYGVFVCDDPMTGGSVEIPVALVCQISLSSNGKQKSQIIHCPRCLGYHKHGADGEFQEGFRLSHCPASHKNRGEIYIPWADHLPVLPFKEARFKIGRGQYL